MVRRGGASPFNPWHSRLLPGPALPSASYRPSTVGLLCSRRWIASYPCRFRRYSLGHRGVPANREFESHPHHHLVFSFRLAITDLEQQKVRRNKGAGASQNGCANDIGQIMRADIHSRKRD
jgi:hypothetical protein